MKKMTMLLILLISFILFSGCTNRDAAQLGSLIGRSLGKPIGVVATAVDETVKTTGDVIKENPRYQNLSSAPLQRTEDVTHGVDESVRYYRAEVLVKTKGPANIQSMSLQETEDVTQFWQ